MSVKKYLDHTGLQYYDSKLKSYVDDNYLPLTGGVEMPTNPFGGKRLYINSIDNAFANADKKFYVTITKHKKTEGGVTYPYVDTSKARTDDNYYVDGPVVATLTSYASLLFNGDYENSINLESNGTTYLKVRIMFGSNTSPSASTSYFSGYPYGYWYLSYYYTSTPNTNSQVRVYNKYSGNTVGWNLYTSTFYNGSPSSENVIQKIGDRSDYQRTCVDFIIYGNDTSGRAVSLTQIEYQLVRPNLSRDGSTVTKYGDQSLYASFTWYQNHTQVAQIASDGTISGKALYENGTSLANKYLQLSGGTITGTSDTPLKIKSSASAGWIQFLNSSGTSLGYLGVNSSGQPAFYDNSSHRLALYSELPSVSNATITIKQSGISDQTFTLNGSATTITLRDTTYSIVDDMNPGLVPKVPASDPQVGTNVLTVSGGTPHWVTGILTDTTYESKTAASGGTDVSLVTTGEKYTWNNKGTYSKPNGGIPDSDLASTFVKVASQTLTDAQKTQARTNIGAGTSSFTGYTSSNKLSTNYINNEAGWTSNSGTVIGSGLTADQIVLGNGTVNVKISSYKPASSSTTWSDSSDVYLPTMKSIKTYVEGKGYTTLAIGTTATTAAAGNHTHTTSIETGGAGTASALSYGTKYTLYAGGNSFIFQMPALGNTSTTAAAGDHTHSQYLTTAVTKLGTRTGDVTLANLKSDLGLGSAAYADSTDFSLVGHTHTKSEITDFPSSLPANGGNADTVDNLHAHNFTRFYLSPMDSGASASSAKTWFTGTMPSSSGAIVYNVPGSEKTIIAGKSSGNYGHMLQLNYDDNYLRLLRYKGGNWQTTDWEKISAGYADSAGSVAWTNVSGRPTNVSSFTNDAGYTTNTGTVIGSGLTADYFVVGNGTVNVKISSLKPTTSSTTWSTSSDVNVPTMKAISSYVTGLGYTTNTGTITGVSVNGTSVATSGVANITSIPFSIISSVPNYAGSSSAGGAANSVANALTLTGGTSATSTTYNGSNARTITFSTGLAVTKSATGDISIATNLSANEIPNLAASKITSGTFDTARIPSLSASIITSGTFADARIASASTWNAKMSNQLTTTGDIVYAKDNNGTPERLGIGSNGKILKVVSGKPSWETEYSYTLPIASNTTLGGVYTYYSTPSTDPSVNAAQTTSGRYYGIQVNSEGKMFVNVPWSNSTSYLSYTATAVSSGTTKNYILGKQTVATNANNYYNSSVYFTSGGNLYATKLYSNNTEVSVSGHTHSYAGSSSAGGAANSVANSFAYGVTGGAQGDTDSYNGSASKTLVFSATQFSKSISGNAMTMSISDSYRAPGVEYTTTAPSANNTSGLKFAVLSSEPATKYSGWVYIITS